MNEQQQKYARILAGMTNEQVVEQFYRVAQQLTAELGSAAWESAALMVPIVKAELLARMIK